MKIWVDADSCPLRIREIASKGSMRANVPILFVANRAIPFPESDLSEMVLTGPEEGSADRAIVERAEIGDLVLTRDIPLASELVEAGITVINDRGTEYTTDNIRQRLSVRNFMAEMRERGVSTPQESVFGKKEIQMFANTFDRLLTRLANASKNNG